MKIDKREFINRQSKNYISVGIAGSIERIGTTTQTLQLIQYLQLTGKTACYLEINKKNYIEEVAKLYSGTKVFKKGGDIISIKLGDIFMYRSMGIVDAIKENLEYYIKDYGCVKDENFERISFLEQDIRIIVCGSKPNEIFHAQEILKNKSYDDANFIFSFVPKDEQDSIKDMMLSKKEKTFFALNCADPYVYNSSMNNVYKQLINMS